MLPTEDDENDGENWMVEPVMHGQPWMMQDASTLSLAEHLLIERVQKQQVHKTGPRRMHGALIE